MGRETKTSTGIQHSTGPNPMLPPFYYIIMIVFGWLLSWLDRHILVIALAFMVLTTIYTQFYISSDDPFLNLKLETNYLLDRVIGVS